MTTLKFILRKSRRGDVYAGKICARMIHSRSVRVQTLEVALYPGEWDESGQRVVFGKEENSRSAYLHEAAAILNDYRSRFVKVTGELECQGRYVLSDIVLESHTRCGLQSFSAHLSRNMKRSGQDRTANAYLAACRTLVAFNKGVDVPLKHINNRMMKEFESHLKGRGLAMNTISYYMRMLRAVYHKAIAEKLIEPRAENPFGNVFTGFKQTRKRALDIEQLKKLNTLDFSGLLEQGSGTAEPGEKPSVKINKADKGLYECWRYFFFCFHARGMSYVDMAYLRKDNIRHGIISYYRKKTGQKIEVTLTPCLRRIIDSFCDEVRYSPYVFPVIRNMDKPARLQYENGLNTQNRRLKNLASLAGIDTGWGLSTHVSRHSWATAGKMQHLPLSVISEGLGHSSEKMTYTYLASFDRSTLDRASRKIDQAITVPRGMSGFSCAMP